MTHLTPDQDRCDAALQALHAMPAHERGMLTTYALTTQLDADAEARALRALGLLVHGDPTDLDTDLAVLPDELRPVVLAAGLASADLPRLRGVLLAPLAAVLA